MLIVPLALAVLALAVVTTRGLYRTERTPLPALACAGGATALAVGLVQAYRTAVTADEQNTSGEAATHTVVLLVTGLVVVAALAVRLRLVSKRAN